MDNFIRLIEKNDLQANDIEKVVVTPHPIVQFTQWQKNSLRTEEDFSFNIPYLLGCAAYRIKTSHWLNKNVKEDQRIREFIKRIEFKIVIDEPGFGLPRIEDPVARPSVTEVLAKGKTFKERNMYLKGSWRPKEFRNTDADLIEKFRDNSSKVLSSDKINEVSQIIIQELDKLEDIGKIIELITP